MASEAAPLAQRSQTKLHFAHKDMDYYLAWIMGREIYGGSRADECLTTAARIPNGDPVAWHRAWEAQAESVEAEAKATLAAGERDRAREAYLRACTYYRAPLFMMSASDPALRPFVFVNRKGDVPQLT